MLGVLRIGFTGTQVGITQPQSNCLSNLIECYFDKFTIHNLEWHHGDCEGADEKFHDTLIEKYLSRNYANRIVIHPPIDESRRAYCKDSMLTLIPENYVARNHNIVDSIKALIVCPQQDEEIVRSGTWSTFRYASKENSSTKIIWIIQLDGRLIYLGTMKSLDEYGVVPNIPVGVIIGPSFPKG